MPPCSFGRVSCLHLTLDSPWFQIKQMERQRRAEKKDLGISMGTVWKRYSNVGRVSILMVLIRRNQGRAVPPRKLSLSGDVRCPWSAIGRGSWSKVRTLQGR